MTYIIENAHVLKGQAVMKTSMLIDGDRISALKPSFKMYNHIRMDTDAFIMTPSHVLLDSNLPIQAPFHVRKEYYLKNFIMRGSTVVLIMIRIQFEMELELKLKQAKIDLTDSPIDYVIAVAVPPRLLKPGFIRTCKRAKIPAIFVEIDDINELYSIPWGWVKEALFPYNSPLIPIFLQNDSKKTKLLQTKAWNELMAKEKVAAVEEEISEMIPISRRILKQIGVIPQKSNLNSGGELSYNLYHKSVGTIQLDEYGLFSSQSANLAVTVDKGVVIRAGQKVYFRPGKGENVIIKTPGFFKDNH